MTTREKPYLKNPWIYFGATFLWTWGLCGVLFFKDMSSTPTLSFMILLLGMIGPGVTGILFTYWTRSKAEIRDYWCRVMDVKRLTLPWLVIAVGLPFGLQVMAGVIDGLSGGVGLRWGDSAAAFIENPVNQILTLCVISLVPFFEELGWRGYAQDVLEEKHSALGASLILGCVWSLWHLPASFIPNTYQAGLGVGTPEFYLHFGGIIVLSVVVSWIYINTQRSILIMVVLHATINLAGELFKLSEMGETIFTFCWVSAAITIVFVFGKEMLMNPETSQDARLRRIVLFLLMGTAAMTSVPTHAQDLKARFESELKNLHEQYDFPGATAAYILPNGQVECVAIGLSDIDQNMPMSSESSMLVASVGKIFVSATVLALSQEGRLQLDNPIATWLADRPWFRRLPNAKTITLRQLLNHTSGLGNHVETEAFAQELTNNWRAAEPMSPEELIAFILGQPPLFMPGEGWAYSDTGYLLVGLIIERVTGRTYEAEIRQRFLDPLNLTRTRPSDQRELPNLATGYLAEENAFGLPPTTTTRPGVMAWHPGLEWTGGGLVSNPRDLVIWGKALFSGQVLVGDGAGALLQSVAIQKEMDHVRYGLGVAIHKGGPLGPAYGHGGWIPGYCTSLRYYPNYDVAVAFQMNTDIGMTDGDVSPVEEIEQRLASVVIQNISGHYQKP